MEFVAGLQDGIDRVDGWARRIEEQGWDGIGVGDHLTPNGLPYGHLFATLGYLASSTSRVQLISTYANALLRSPVEFAHAAYSLQALSQGRFEAGLGAGWAQEEVEAMGFEFSSFE